MRSENKNVKRLFENVSESTSFLQASGETDHYLFYSTYIILETFTFGDWRDLKRDLPNWNEDQLDVLVTTLSQGDGENNNLGDNYYIGYIFTIAPNVLASSIFYNCFDFFFYNNEIHSISLLDSIETKINLLFESNFIYEKATYTYWIDYIEKLKKKAIC